MRTAPGRRDQCSRSFPGPVNRAGHDGTGLTGATAFATSSAGLTFWQARLAEKAIEFQGPMERFDEQYIAFSDPDGMKLELVVADQAAAFQPWSGSTVPADFQLRGFHSVTLNEQSAERTGAVLAQQMGWKLLKASGGRSRYQAPGGGPASLVDVLSESGMPRGLPGNGTVHHVAFRVADDATQVEWLKTLSGLGHNVSPVRDRAYFHSIYFREAGGILFEIATDPPGFTVDEPLETLGTELKLPAQFEHLRAQIEKVLPPLA